MAAEKTINDRKASTKEAVSTPATPDKNALSTEDLDKVSGGINPQPLPPMPRRNQ